MQNSRAFKQLLEVLMTELPAKQALPFGSNGTDFACAHGMEVGYLRAIETMKLLAQSQPTQELEASFGDNN
tara:strand:+ start:1045 stop:1257 length:213 start_codon:yes stop_codon:yes gene_type:complete